MLARATLESLLRAHKLDRTLAVFPTGLGGAPASETVATGHARADQCLEGGWPRGHLSVLCGPLSAGRTTLIVGTLAAVTRAGELAALVDAADRFDPVPAAARGVVLERVLWVR
ncbi:MAG: DNA recombination/repair protein RecA, partial [Acidobacteriota bacterium]|nr:DNA recombination/repair protein RecA [Acidobacteriota bacterium]